MGPSFCHSKISPGGERRHEQDNTGINEEKIGPRFHETAHNRTDQEDPLSGGYGSAYSGESAAVHDSGHYRSNLKRAVSRDL